MGTCFNSINSIGRYHDGAPDAPAVTSLVGRSVVWQSKYEGKKVGSRRRRCYEHFSREGCVKPSSLGSSSSALNLLLAMYH